MTIAQGQEVYLGDGLYASFDGFGIKLRAPRICHASGRACDHICYLEPAALLQFETFVAQLRKEVRAK